jgi:hypothetical protein
MKMMVKLAVLMAALLLSGVAFAFCPPQGGYCYRVSATDLDNPENSCTRDVIILFNDENNCGYFISPPPQTNPDYPPIFMFLGTFFDAMNKKATGGLLLFDSISLKFHGDDFHVVSGELFSACFPFSMFCGGDNQEIRCGEQVNGERYHYSLRGIKQEDCEPEEAIGSLGNIINQTETMFMDTVQALSNKLKTQ